MRSMCQVLESMQFVMFCCKLIPLFYFKKWQIELVADPESVVPLPMIIIRKKQKIILLLEKIISKLHNK